MTTFLLNSLGRDRPRSDPLFIKIYAMDSCRVDGVPFLVCYRPLASFSWPCFFDSLRTLRVSYNASIWSNRSDHVTCGRNFSNEFVRLAFLAVLSKLLPFYAVQTRAPRLLDDRRGG